VSRAALALLLVCSGAAALAYQTLWAKQLGLVVGVDVYAITTVVSAFFAGLALGGASFGARADRTSRPLRLYAGLELGIGLAGATTTVLLARLPAPYVAIERASGLVAWAIPFLIVMVPAVFMGGTLPALVRAAGPGAHAVSGTSGRLYAANTAGAVLGALATPLVLVPAFGVRGTGFAAAATNVALALVALLLDREVAPPPAERAPAEIDAPLALGLYAVAGGVALGYEVVWSQAVVQFVNTRAYAFAIVLAVYLTGLVLGSAVWARVADRVRRPWLAFGLLEAGAGMTALACFGLLGTWLPQLQVTVQNALFARTGSLAAAVGGSMVVAPLALLFVPTLLLGAAFPAAARLACGAARIGRDVGAVTALNTAGGILGTLATGFLAVPWLGLRGSLAALATTAVVVGGVAMVHGAERRGRAVVLAAAAAIATVAAGVAIPRDRLAQLLVATRPGTLDAYEESAGGTVAVVTEPWRPKSFHRLYIHGVSNSNDGLMSRRYMRLQTLIPLLIHQGESRSALVVGLGTGITCGTTLVYPALERRVCVELLPAVVRTVDRFDGNYGVAHDPRIDLRIRDGRHELLRSEDTYDLITLEPPPPTAAGVVNLYSSDFYALCRSRLAPGGIMAQWFPLAQQTDSDARSLVRSFLDVFPYVTLWSTELHETLLVGSMIPQVLDAVPIAQRFVIPSVQDALVEVGVVNPVAFLSTYLMDRQGLEAFAAGGLPTTDDQPRLEHASLVQRQDLLQVLGRVLELRSAPLVVNSSPELDKAIADERDRLHTFYRAAMLWYAGKIDEMNPLLERVLSEDGANPYYRWFVGGG
jgi:predicted membrane-bound spermidine synthase